MSAVVRQLRRTTTVDGQPVGVELAADYCECNRGPVIGIVQYTDRQVRFFSLDSWQASTHHDAADLRCVDCLAEAALAVANGTVRERMQKLSRQRAEGMQALMRTNAMRREAGLPIVPAIIPEGNDWPLTQTSAPVPAQTLPTDGDQVT
jgi:hypothetical protein